MCRNKFMSEEQIQYCTFYLDNSFFGVEAMRVQEIARPQNLTTIPLMPDYVRGLINLRGDVVMSIDMGLKLNATESYTRPHVNLVVRDQLENSISLMVDQVGDVIELNASSMTEIPENIEEPTRRIVKGVYKLNDRFMLVLDVDKVADQIFEIKM